MEGCVTEQYPVNNMIWFPLCEQPDEQTVELTVIWEFLTLTRRHRNEWRPSWHLRKKIDVAHKNVTLPVSKMQ